MDAIRRGIRRKRADEVVYPLMPENAMFDIPHPFDLTATGEQFLQYDNQRHDRMLIFGTIENLDFLQNSAHWFMDGNSQQSRHSLCNFIMCMVLITEDVIGAYCLLANKRLDTYTEMLSQIQILTNQVNPQSVMIDFDQSALDRVYPLVPQRGRLFHLSKSIYRKVQELGLSELYTNEDVFRTNIRMITAISFVPIEDMIQAFDVLSHHAGIKNN